MRQLKIVVFDEGKMWYLESIDTDVKNNKCYICNIFKGFIQFIKSLGIF
jgi:hypothetical protein